MKTFGKTQALLAAGLLATSGAVSSRADAAGAPAPPGKLYEVGGHAMHLYATGEERSGPSVVLEAGSGAFSIDWNLVQTKVARFAPVCSYDRAGHAWSELGPGPRTMRQAAHDLRVLLQAAGIRGPHVMVGHSLGGLFVRVFAAEYPDEVAGMVLVDSSMEDSPMFLNGKMVDAWDDAKPRVIPPVRDSVRDDERSLSTPEMEGYHKFREWAGAPKIEEPFDRLPEAIQKLRLWAMSLPQSNVTDYNACRAEEYLLLFADRVRREHPLGNKPLVVLTRKTDEAAHMEGQRRLLDLSSNSLFAVSGFPIHEIQLAQPDLVVEAVQAVIKSIETGGRLELLPGGGRPRISARGPVGIDGGFPPYPAGEDSPCRLLASGLPLRTRVVFGCEGAQFQFGFDLRIADLRPRPAGKNRVVFLVSSLH